MSLKKQNTYQLKQHLVFLSLLFGLICTVNAQENPVSTTVDTTSIRIGEQIQFKIQVQSVDEVIFPELELDSLKKIEVVESLPIDTLKNILEKKYLLTSFDSGRYQFPEQKVFIALDTFYTKSFMVDVVTVKVDTTKQKMFPIKAIKEEPKTFDDYKHLLWWLIPILVLIAVILYFIFRKKAPEEEVKIYVAPIQEALQRLKELDEKQLLQQNKIKAYYSELTDIVRTYIEKDIKIPALESTTNELVETIIDFNESSHLGIAPETITQLKKVLEGADLVKFAKSKPLVEEIRTDRSIIEEIIKNTETAVHENDEHLEFGAEEAVTIKESIPENKLQRLNKKVIIYTLLAILVFGSLGFFGYQFIKTNYLGQSTVEMLDSEWITFNYGNPPITIETPELLKLKSVQLPENSVTSVGDFVIYTYGSLQSNFYIAVSTTKFLSELRDLDLDVGVQSSIKGMEAQLKTTFTNIKNEDISINGVRGKKVQVEYKKRNERTNFKDDHKLTMLFFANSTGMRQVYISSLWKDETADLVVDRVINSISINP